MTSIPSLFPPPPLDPTSLIWDYTFHPEQQTETNPRWEIRPVCCGWQLCRVKFCCLAAAIIQLLFVTKPHTHSRRRTVTTHKHTDVHTQAESSCSSCWWQLPSVCRKFLNSEVITGPITVSVISIPLSSEWLPNSLWVSGLSGQINIPLVERCRVFLVIVSTSLNVWLD